MVRKAEELLKTSQKAIVIFTRGDKFTFDQNGGGSTGNWNVMLRKRMKVAARDRNAMLTNVAR